MIQHARNKIEFRVGDKITYAPYEKEFEVKVTAVDVIPVGRSTTDDRIFYNFKLDGIEMTSSGLCIKESIYFYGNDEQ
ncbi:hypothetical protein KAU11_08575 [Candidatus Babeliales bacterium]|nr:hypothetical protein [Candidatus Babeliales bacterium]